MSCDIHIYIEIKKDDCWLEFVTSLNPFSVQSYAVFGFLADVRNYSAIESISPCKGLPNDLSESISESYIDYADFHGHSWLTLEELLNVDYSKIVEDRRFVEKGQGKFMKLSEFLGPSFMNDLELLKSLGDPKNVRIVFWFDN